MATALDWVSLAMEDRKAKQTGFATRGGGDFGDFGDFGDCVCMCVLDIP